MPCIHKAPVRHNRAHILIAYLQGKTIQVSYPNRTDNTGEWMDIIPYHTPSDVLRLSNSNYSFRIKEEQPAIESAPEVQFKKGDKVMIVGNKYQHCFGIGAIAEYCEPFEKEGNHLIIGIGTYSSKDEKCEQILHHSDFVKA